MLGRVAVRPLGVFQLTSGLYHDGSVRADARMVKSVTWGSLTQEALTASERSDYDHGCLKKCPRRRWCIFLSSLCLGPRAGVIGAVCSDIQPLPPVR